MPLPALRIPAFAFLIALAGSLPPTAAQAPLALGLAPLANKSQNQNLDVVALMAGSSINLSLRLLGSFQLSPVIAADQTAARAAAEREGLAGVLFGAVEEAPDGSIRLSVALFDRLKDSLSHSQTATAATLLDVFEASDQLTAKLVEALAGRKVGFGALELALSSARPVDGPGGAAPAGLTVLLNGTPLSLAEGRLPPIPAGDYQLELRQKRFGKDISLLKQALTIKENQKSAVALAIPELTEEERAAFKTFDREIMELIPEKRIDAINKLRQEEAMLKQDTIGPGAAQRSAVFGEWADYLSTASGGPGESPKDFAYHLLAAVRRNDLVWENEYQTVYKEFLPYFDLVLPRQDIKTDGSLDDWTAINPVINDAQGDNYGDIGRPNSDLKALYFYRDAAAAYLAITNYGDSWPDTCDVWLECYFVYQNRIGIFRSIKIAFRSGLPILASLVDRQRGNLESPLPYAEIKVGACIELKIPLQSIESPRSVIVSKVEMYRPITSTRSWTLTDGMGR